MEDMASRAPIQGVRGSLE
ncbi:uncharacterized protein FPRN_09362 [Fusarium proliferatum]|nr:uncharacterized protein FPRN_09362 [Fusarium proliferatum]SCV35636.1 uncharacterized protein FFB14_05646 [Fusarium fujikuroi]